MSNIYLQIEDLESLKSFVRDAKGKGFFKDTSVIKMEESLKDRSFPIQVPIDVDAVLKLAGNPVVKKVFGSKIEEKASEILNIVMETG